MGKIKKIFILLTVFAFLLGACGTGSNADTSKEESGIDFESLEKTKSVELSYATQFNIDKYGEYEMITIVDGGRFLLVSEDAPVPDNIPEDITVIKKPLSDVYLLSSCAMDLIVQTGSMDCVKYTATKKEDWCVEEAARAIDNGDLIYAGKYSAPDYEMLVAGECRFAIANTMINHNPEVKEKLEELGITVMVERSSYETHPLGRLEWIKLYGVLFDKEEEANAYFEQQVREVEPIIEKDNTGKKVAFFAVNSNGSITVRKPNDYVAKMIGLAGGNYVLSGYVEEEENALSSMNMQVEDFYAWAKDADVLIYNGTIEGELSSVDELIEKNSLFADFKAVKNGMVFTTGSDFYQQTSQTCIFIEDLNKVLEGETVGENKFLKKLK